MRNIGSMASNGQKLSKPQKNLLKTLPCKVDPSYAPVRKLVELGLASVVEGSGRLSQPRYVRTPAGEDWLKAHPVL